MAVDQKDEVYVFHTTWPFNEKMVNVQEPRTTRSAGNVLDITPMAIDPKPILCNNPNPSLRMVYANPEFTRN